MEYRDPQPMHYDGRRYGRDPHTEFSPGRGILWNQPIRHVPARYVENLLRDGFRLALEIAEAAEWYGVAQKDIREAEKQGLILHEEDRGTHYTIADIKARKAVQALAAARKEKE